MSDTNDIKDRLEQTIRWLDRNYAALLKDSERIGERLDNRQGWRNVLEAADRITALEAERDALHQRIATSAAAVTSLAAEVERLKPKSGDGSTHWEGCWEHRHHHECAIREVERLREVVGKLKTVALRMCDAVTEASRSVADGDPPVIVDVKLLQHIREASQAARGE